MTVALTIDVCGDILPTMIILSGDTDCTIKDLTLPDNLYSVTQEKTWIYERLMKVWYEKKSPNVRERNRFLSP